MHSELRLESIGSFITGMTSVFGGARRVFCSKGLKRFIIIPFLLNVVILSAMIYLSFHFIYPALESYVPAGDSAFMKVLMSVLGYVFKIIFILISLFAMVILYSIVGMAVCAPFIEPISEKVEEIVSGKKINSSFSVISMFKSIGGSIKASIWFFLFYIGFNVILLLLNLIPVAGTIVYIVISTMSFLFFMGYQICDSIFARKDYTFSKKLGTLFRIKWAAMGVGFGFFILTCIPVAGYLSIIFSAAGATEMYFRWPSRPK